MSITTKLNTEWIEQVENVKIFAVRAAVQNLRNNIDDFFTHVEGKYPTGDATFDAYVVPIKDSIIAFRQLLDQYAEFIQWEQP